MTARISQQRLESYLWGAATLLRGTIDAGDYKQFIFPLLFYKRLCDVYDEETRSALAESEGDKEFAAYPENHRFQIPPEAHWKETRKVAKNVGAALQNALRAIETANPDKLYGIFGDAQWTNKDRLSDAMLRDLIEHFSSLELTLANLPEDELGNGYEYLIRKFADDAGHTAAEFYTNRTVVHLMTEMLQPQPGESIYDPTCGSGGMLLSCIAQLRRQGKEWRNARLYGQERNLMTSSIARMNCFLHGIEDFRIERGDTLAEPKFVQGDHLQRFDIILANPPYSIKQWDREAFASDPWGRNIFGTPPQGRADYAFWQHIIQSMDPKSGRCAILFPHGVLFRQEEAGMREKIIEADLIECILGLGPNLFYNSPMEACVIICRTVKPKQRRNKILFINAVGEVTRERAQSYLTEKHIERIVNAYEQFRDEPGFTRVVSLEEIRKHDFSTNITLYITNTEHRRTAMHKSEGSIDGAYSAWLTGAKNLRESLSVVLDKAVINSVPSADDVRLREPAWLDRSKWQTFRFDQIAENIRESVMPTPGDSANYIGLEHMDTGSLHVRRWGSEADLIGQKLRMRKGDILFARRNAYLRRVAIAPHEGLFSAHGMILRAKPDVVLEGLLPFLMMSNRFMNRAVEISVGSLSPTINWTTLKHEEFALPPLDQQRHIAEILWAVDGVQQQYDSAMTTLAETRSALVEEHFTVATSKDQKKDLGSAADISYGITLGGYRATLPAERPYLRVANVLRDRLDLGEIKTVKCTEDETTKFALRDGDVLVVEGHASVEEIGRSAVWHGELSGVLHQNHLIRVRCSNMLLPNYLNLYLNSAGGRRYIRSRAKSSSGLNTINSTVLKKLPVPIARLEEQAQLTNSVNLLDLALASVQRAQAELGSSLRCLINEVLL